MEDIQNLLEALKGAPAILKGLIQNIPEERLDVRRGDGFWTIAEHLSHLAEVQPMLLKRIERFMNENHPVFVPYIPPGGEDGPQTPARMDTASALDQFARYREKQLALIEGVDDATMSKTATHPEYEAYTLHILIRHALLHDFWHMYRMEELWLVKDAHLSK